MGNAENYLMSGNNKMLLGDYLGAIFDFTKAILSNPSLPHPYTSRASAKMEMHDYDGAIEDCTAAIKLHFKSEVKIDENLSGERKLRINPIYARIYSIMGTAKLVLGKTDEAIVDLNASRLMGNNDVVDIMKVYSK
jgi:tetratricopeptide (TPR) repeat protein